MEYYSKCNVCGKITCYTDNDLKNNKDHAFITTLASISTIANAVAGTKYDMYESNKLADRESSKIVDYSKCPNCGSKDTVLVTKKFAIYSNKINHAYSIDDLLKEAKIYLEKQDYENAFCFATMVLNEEEKNYDAFMIRFLSSYEVASIEELSKKEIDYSDNPHFKNVLNTANDKNREKLWKSSFQNKLNIAVIKSKEILEKSDDETSLTDIEYNINELNKKSENKEIEELIEKLKTKKKQVIYFQANKKLEEATELSITEAVALFNKIDGFKDVENKLNKCKYELQSIKKKNEKTIILYTIIILAIAIAIPSCVVISIDKNNLKKYENAKALVEEKKYNDAIVIYDELNNYKDSKENANELKYLLATEDYNNGYFAGAAEQFEKIINYKNSKELRNNAMTYYHIKNLNYHEDVRQWFNQNKDNFELIKDNDEIKRIIVNKWLVGYRRINYNDYSDVHVVNENGTITRIYTYGEETYYWNVQNGYLYYCQSSPDSTGGNVDKYELRKAFDNIYLLYEVDYNTTKDLSYVLVEDNSISAKKLDIIKN